MAGTPIYISQTFGRGGPEQVLASLVASGRSNCCSHRWSTASRAEQRTKIIINRLKYVAIKTWNRKGRRECWAVDITFIGMVL
jgi:hypothetical protein